MRLQVGHLFEGNIAGGNSTKQNKHATKFACLGNDRRPVQS
jgi:hypothetical protein